MATTTRASAFEVHRLAPGDDRLRTGMLDLFAEAFEDPGTCRGARPSAAHRRRLLARDDVVALVALADRTVVGALVAYLPSRFEQDRAEVCIHDLAVAEACRRRGVATAMIDALLSIARADGGWTVYVQAEHGDDAAVALYTRLGTRRDVMHVDIPVD